MKLISLHRLALIAVALSGCESNEGPGDGTAEIRLMHAQSGADAVDLVLNGTPVATGVGFAQTSGLIDVPAGAAAFQIRPSGGGTALAIGAAELESGARYTILFSRSGTSDMRIAADTATGIPSAPPPTQPGDTGAIPGESKIKLRVIHNAPDAPPLDVYLTLNDEPLDGAFPLVEPFTYGVGLSPEFPGYVERDPGIWRLRFTADGTLQVLLDTGPIQMAAGQVRSVILMESDSTGMGIASVRER